MVYGFNFISGSNENQQKKKINFSLKEKEPIQIQVEAKFSVPLSTRCLRIYLLVPKETKNPGFCYLLILLWKLFVQ